MEFEPGLCKDFPSIMEKIAPKKYEYSHHRTWKDDNGRSHVKATIMGSSLAVPFLNKKICLGTWQQIIFFEWDTKKRKREIIMQFIGKR